MDGYLKLKKKIDSYLTGNDKRPLVVDVSSLKDLDELLQLYITIDRKDVFGLADSSEKLPSLGNIYEFLSGCTFDKCFIDNLGTYLRLYGCDIFESAIHSLLNTSYSTKFVILTYQCSRYFKEKDPRNKGKIICLNSDEEILSSSLVFVPTQYQELINAISGLCEALTKFEKSDGKKIYVTTSYEKKDFPNSLIRIDECNSPYDILCLRDSSARKLNRKLGSEKNWNDLLAKLENNSIEETISNYIRVKDISSELKDWFNKNPFEQWLLFIYLKLKNASTGIWSVDWAIEKTQNANDFIFNIYKSILEIHFKEPEFWKKYDSRKCFLKSLNDDSIFYDYCNLVPYKEENAIYYLTDNNDNEKKLILKTIDKYKDKYPKSKLLSILQHVYKDLYDYLQEYNYNDKFLSDYFNKYKYLKVINTLTPEFKEIVDQEARERSFIRRLPLRPEILQSIDVKDSIAYFVDALGVEFLSFIERKCQEKKLACRINVCRSYLPSITCKNTEFKDFFAKNGIRVVDEKRLDNLIHDGKDDYDFDKTKLPIHIIEEFRIIEDCLDHIKKSIKNQTIKKAIIISDHGATRLAILNTDMIKEDVGSKGHHGGRICEDVPDAIHIPNAIVADGYCILADYNSFKGGRVGKVEMHGGATLEEVAVPIIEIFEQSSNVQIVVSSKIIKVSYKKKAELCFYSSIKMNNVSVRINGKTYAAVSNDKSNFTVELPDIQKSGEYKFEVWEGSEMRSFDNMFEVEKESAKTNDLWED